MPAADQNTQSPLDLALARLPGYAPLALAVSGGADSTALMHAAARTLNRDHLTVLTVDHGLRSAAADEARLVTAQAKALGLRHVTLYWEDAKPRSGVQAAARKARYKLMTDWCLSHGVRHLVTAHTLDDQAETVLMRLKRGSGVDGLAGMLRQSWRSGIQLHRPLLDITHAELVETLQSIGQVWSEDPSNMDDQFERIQIRQSMETFETLGLTRGKLAATARRMARVRDALDQAAQHLLAVCADVSEFGYCQLRAGELRDASDEIAVRALARCIQAVGGGAWPPGDGSLERILGWLRADPSSATTLGGCRLVLRGDALLIVRELGRISERQVTLLTGSKLLWDGRFQVAAEGPCHDLTIGPLASEGWAALKMERPDLPAVVGRTLPAVRSREHIVAVPSIAYVSEEAGENARFSAHFTNSQLICGKRD